MIAVYLDNAIRFDRLAAQETNPKLKAHFEEQALAYRGLAAESSEPASPTSPNNKID
jgi:hypothetical protein